MAKIRLLTSMAGINFSHDKGEIIDCTDAQALRYVEAGIAEAIVSDEPKIERAVKKGVTEKAIKG
jgi:ABC-type nitrate/sulfonate/bicarbonate transport system substrate-binding protein